MGTNHTCGVTSAGALKCWGRNSVGQLGDGTTTTRTSPVVIDSGVSYISVSVGYQRSCGITTSGVLNCWGGGIGLSPVMTEAGTSYASISARGGHTCGITSAGITKCWGPNSSGEIGNGQSTSLYPSAAIDSTTTYSQISGDIYANNCAIATSGELRCWGVNDASSVGDRTSVDRSAPVTIDRGVSYLKISQASGSTCGITTSSKIKCWGFRNIGTGAASSTSPVLVDSLTDYIDVAAGMSRACGITSTNILKCWSGTNLPSVVDAGVSYAKIASGSGHTCGITTAGALKCFGSNGNGQLGDGTLVDKASPVFVSAGPGESFLEVTASNSHTCAINNANTLKCWGVNFFRHLGDGTTTQRTTPVVADGGTQYAWVKVGQDRTCGRTTAGVLRCWGFGFGNPTVADAANFSQVSVTNNSVIGITNTGELRAFGSLLKPFTENLVYVVD